MSPRADLRLDWCSYAAAKYAVEHWHYSHTMPRAKLTHLGAWEGDRFIGSLIFGTGSGASTNGRRFGLAIAFEMAELARVALCPGHRTPVSRLLAIACRMQVAQSPSLRLMLSYADPEQHHHGGIYQAAGWLYIGRSGADYYAIDKSGRRWHSRVCSASGFKTQYGKRTQTLRLADAERIVKTDGKHTYLFPLDAAMRQRILPLALPYPKRAASIASDAPAHQAGEGGVTPTAALQVSA